MDTIALLFIVIAGMSLSLLAAHLWVGVIDTMIHGIKRCFPIGKRKDIAWHALKTPDAQKDANQKIKPKE